MAYRILAGALLAPQGITTRIKERNPMVILHKPEVKYLGIKDRYFNYTLGGIAHYRAEIAILTENGYTASEHDVLDRDGNAMTVAALYRNGIAVKAYEL